MLAITGRVTMLGLSRWTEKGGSYRTIQRFFYTVIPWAQVFWTFFCEHLFDQQDTYLLAGDECVITKAGEKTHGLDCFFSGLLKKAVPGLSFFTLALISIQQRRSYPVCMEQTVRSEAEKVVSQAKKQAKKARSGGSKRRPGRPKGSRNKNKTAVELNPELQRIQKMVQGFLNLIRGTLHLTFQVLLRLFRNLPTQKIILRCQLHLISKLRTDAA